MALAWRFGAQPLTLAWCAFAATLVALAAIDWDTTLLPDVLTMPLLWAGLIVAALGSASFQGAWLNAKLALFGLVILVGNGLRLLPGTSSMALMAQIHREGSTPEREAALNRRLRLTYPIILTMYGCVVISLFLGVLKP